MANTLDLSQDKLVFDQEFNSASSLSLRSSSNPNGVFDTTYNNNLHSLPSNGEKEYYVSADQFGSMGVDPFSVNNGHLTIAANPTPSSASSQTGGLPYTSGLLTTQHSFSQTYGIFQMTAQLPAGQGLWPAFWMLPTDNSWPPEIDVVEALGNNMTQLYTSTHSTATSPSGITKANTVADMSNGYHTYTVDWEPNTITYYYDGQEVYQIATPADMHKPMYMLANLAVGGGWPGDPNSSTHFPADMNIASIQAYATANTIPSVNTTTLPSTTHVTTTQPPTTTTPAPTSSSSTPTPTPTHTPTPTPTPTPVTVQNPTPTPTPTPIPMPGASSGSSDSCHGMGHADVLHITDLTQLVSELHHLASLFNHWS